MANKNIFCNIPWYEININHDGSYDLCGCQNDKIVGTPLGQVHNIKTIPIMDYWNSERIRKSRLIKLGDTPDPMCKMCQVKDRVGYQSNRVKENIKSAIFQESFDRSFEQSVGFKHFNYSLLNDGHTTSKPRSLHINLGNHCNFSCRMCAPIASTRVQTDFLQLKWMTPEEKITHWADTVEGWNNFIEFLDQARNDISVIHIIGGEVEFIPKFNELIDYFIKHNLAHKINFSFNSNGSINYSKYFDRLEKFRRCEIGVSVESIDPINDYIRQGGNVNSTLNNLLAMKHSAPANMNFALRTVPSLLSLPYYAKLIKWAWDHTIPMDNSILVWPAWLQASLLSDEIKQATVVELQSLLDSMPSTTDNYINQKNINMIDISIRNECESMIKLASIQAPDNSNELLSLCANKLSEWDKLKNTNLKSYSPMLFDFLSKHGYKYEGH